MRFKVVFSQGALRDLHEARSWYNLQQTGLGKKLIADVRCKECGYEYKTKSYYASVKFSNVRTVACKKFPYSIHYEIDEANDLVRIISVFHFSRKPYWLDE